MSAVHSGAFYSFGTQTESSVLSRVARLVRVQADRDADERTKCCGFTLKRLLQPSLGRLPQSSGARPAAPGGQSVDRADSASSGASPTSSGLADRDAHSAATANFRRRPACKGTRSWGRLTTPFQLAQCKPDLLNFSGFWNCLPKFSLW